MKLKRVLASGLTFFLMLILCSLPAATADTEGGSVNISAGADSSFTYSEYASTQTGGALPVAEARVSASTPLISFEGRGNCADLRHGGSAEYTASISEEGFYRISVSYFVDKSVVRPLEISLKIDGELPFQDAECILLPKVYENERKSFIADKNGNQLCPVQTAISGWNTVDLYGGEFTNAPYLFYFKTGEHTLSFSMYDGKTVISDVRVYNPEAAAEYEAKPGIPAQEKIVIDLQGEHADRKSDPTLYPTYDRSSPVTQPNDAGKILLNTIGGSSTWSKNRQWLEWDFDVEISGYYQMVLRVRQNEAIGINSYRRFLIDGKVPFAELEAYKIHYNTQWQIVTLGKGEEPFIFYLDEGHHTLRIEAVPGDSEYTVAVIEKEVEKLNSLYQSIVMITGASPDLNRDYYLDEQIPDLIQRLRSISQNLLDEYNRVSSVNRSLGSQLSFLKTFSSQLESFCEHPTTIPKRLSHFKSNISTLSSLMINIQSLPLEVDYIRFQTPGQPLPTRDAGFFGNLWFEISRFVASFMTDYDIVGSAEEYDQHIEVWTTSGRDQAQIIRNMIDNFFSPQYNISVKLSLLPGSSVTEPIMAGKAPDVLIGVGRSFPINLASRGVLQPLDDLPGFEEVKGRFQSEAFVPYQMNGKTYALPETQEFNMLFVRTDIFDLLNLQIPSTWDELLSVVPAIVQNNLSVGLPNGIHSSITSGMTGSLPSILPALLLQNGMNYYKNEKSTVFSSREGIEVFYEFTKFYTDYDCEIYFDALNRFRTGEMPLMIAPFSTNNSLYLMAPEIKGLWKMLPILGTEKEQSGEKAVDISEEDTGTATILFADDGNREAAWKFLSWWSSDQVQSDYSMKLETILGASARYSTANLNAFETLSWSKEELEVLRTQRNSVCGIPEHPASYIIHRNLANAFLEVVQDGKNAKETIVNYSVIMDNELERKQVQLERRGMMK